MRTPEGCDGKCQTCGIVQQAYCGLNKQIAAQSERLEKIESVLSVLNGRMGADLLTAQRGGGADLGKASADNLNKQNNGLQQQREYLP